MVVNRLSSLAFPVFYLNSPQYFQMIEEVISQIVLHKNGLDPDFRGHFTFDVQVWFLVAS